MPGHAARKLGNVCATGLARRSRSRSTSGAVRRWHTRCSPRWLLRNQERDAMKITMLMLSILTTATAPACFAMPTPNVRHAAKANADVRGLARVHLRQGRVLVSGPAIVRHLETEGAGMMMLYLTDDPGIGDRGCPGSAAEAAPCVGAP